MQKSKIAKSIGAVHTHTHTHTHTPGIYRINSTANENNNLEKVKRIKK